MITLLMKHCALERVEKHSATVDDVFHSCYIITWFYSLRFVKDLGSLPRETKFE